MAPIDDSPLATAAAEPELPIVKEMKELDEQYLAVEREYEKEAAALRAKYTDLQKPFLDQRGKKLQDPGEDKTGTPACKAFWLKALQNHPAFRGEIESYDEPVLEYLQDIQTVDLEPGDRSKGFRLRFIFMENPFFDNAVLSKEYKTKEESPWTGETSVEEVQGCKINWKAGKDVTVEKASKSSPKAKGKKGSPKTKKKSEMEPRSSFFRGFFRSMKKDGQLPDDVDPMQIAMEMGAEEDELEEQELLQMVMEQDHEVGEAIRDNIIPFAVRWYTGEASPDMDDDDDEEGEEEDDEEDEEESSEEESEPKGKKGGKKNKKSPKTGGGAEKPKEECKQQ